MRLPRPYIPLDVRLQVAARQLGYALPPKLLQLSRRNRLARMLQLLFGNAPRHLDHDPALCNREQVFPHRLDPKTLKYIARYNPDANDPAYLIYRLKDDHRTKTYLRGDGAQRSDVAQQRYLKRVAARKKPRAKFKPRKAKHIRRSHAVSGHGEKT